MRRRKGSGRRKEIGKNLKKYVNVEDNTLCVTESPLV
jgi:hypothetical protein